MSKNISIRFPEELFEYVRYYSFSKGHLNFSTGLFEIIADYKMMNPIDIIIKYEEIRQQQTSRSN